MQFIYELILVTIQVAVFSSLVTAACC